MLFTKRLLPTPLPNERLVMELRRHWFSFARQAFMYVLLLIGPAVAYYLIDSFESSLWTHLYNGALTEAITRLAVSLYYLGVWVFFFYSWLDYYLDVWVVTSERVLSLEQNGVFNRRVAELRLSRVQDVSSQVKGIWETLLHFGDVSVETAGEQPNVTFHQVPGPYEVSERLLRLVDEWNRENPRDKEADKGP
jgi:uncharacterized membrane protein YdbT with pleckstrin-like domain